MNLDNSSQTSKIHQTELIKKTKILAHQNNPSTMIGRTKSKFTKTA